MDEKKQKNRRTREKGVSNLLVGCSVGCCVGRRVGCRVGCLDGCDVG